jgi:threonine dehydrogenase-like Zn-dependent dehydrogenase
MTGNPNLWVMDPAGQKLEPAEGQPKTPGVEDLVVEIDSCSLWHSNVGFEFGGVHADALPTAQPRVNGHVVEAGDNALYLVDREVTLAAIVPCGQQDRCWTGGVTTCPNKPANGDCLHGAAPSIVAPASAVSLAPKHEPASLGPGLTPFKDG